MSIAIETTTVLAASTVQAVGAVIAVLTTIGFVAYVIANLRAGRDEVGSEIELAPNRKPYYDDEQLETTKLNRTLASGVVLLGIVAVGLPLYWLAEPGRQEGAEADMLRKFTDRGLEQYEEGSQCANCHGPEGTGGQAPYTLFDANGGFVANLQWRAPALNTVLLRFSRDEVFNIITYGRPGTPMVGWGAEGGGPRTTQEIENVIDYLASVQLSSEESQEAVAAELVADLGLLQGDDLEDPEKVAEAAKNIDYDSLATGEALFNLGRETGFASGAYACGRCHTRGWSMITEGDGAVEPASAGALLGPYTDYHDGSGGGIAPPLDDLLPRKFASVDELAEFVSLGSIDGLGFGIGGQGSGRMPGFGDDPNTEAVADDGQYTREMVCAVARYAATLQGNQEPLPEVPTTVAPPPTTTTTVADGEDAEESAAPTPPFCSDEAIEALNP
ncbi:MAG TPA: c-type cytochrome [Acidimicrobiales bacterium]|nr:c-type cytochrome [Acidimicrobiales bacterium]